MKIKIETKGLEETKKLLELAIKQSEQLNETLAKINQTEISFSAQGIAFEQL